MNRVERLVAELREAAARVTEARLAWEAGRLHVAELRARHAEALRAKEEIEEELLTGQSRRPLIDAAEAAAEAEDTADEHQRGPTAPAPAEPPATAARKRDRRTARKQLARADAPDPPRAAAPPQAELATTAPPQWGVACVLTHEYRMDGGETDTVRVVHPGDAPLGGVWRVKYHGPVSDSHYWDARDRPRDGVGIQEYTRRKARHLMRLFGVSVRYDPSEPSWYDDGVSLPGSPLDAKQARAAVAAGLVKLGDVAEADWLQSSLHMEPDVLRPGRKAMPMTQWRPIAEAVRGHGARMARKAVLSVVTQPQAGTCHWDVHRWTLGTRLNRGAMVGTQIAATEAEARKLAKEAWGPAIVIGDPHRHGPHCGCPQPDDADEPAEAAEPPRPRSRPRSRSRSRSRTERRTS